MTLQLKSFMFNLARKLQGNWMSYFFGNWDGLLESREYWDALALYLFFPPYILFQWNLEIDIATYFVTIRSRSDEHEMTNLHQSKKEQMINICVKGKESTPDLQVRYYQRHRILISPGHSNIPFKSKQLVGDKPQSTSLFFTIYTLVKRLKKLIKDLGIKEII